MNRIGIVSTSFIAKQLYSASKEITVEHEFTALYSRSLDKGYEFSKDLDINLKIYDDYDAFLNSNIDIVYICSCNKMHVSQAVRAINAKKHVLIEKPMVLDPNDVEMLYELAKQNGVFIMEALTTIANPIYLELKQFLKNQEIKKVNFYFAKKSRLYDDYLKGEYFNVFDAKMGGGALNDLGIYLLYPLVDLFGTPIIKTASFTNSNLNADLATSCELEYDSFKVDLKCAKDREIKDCSTIVTTTNIIKIDSLGAMCEVLIYDCNENLVKKLEMSKHNMSFELTHFLESLDSKESKLYTKNLAQQVHQLRADILKYNKVD